MRPDFVRIFNLLLIFAIPVALSLSGSLLSHVSSQPTELSRFFETAEPYIDDRESGYDRRRFQQSFAAAYRITLQHYVDPTEAAALVDAAIRGVQDLNPGPEGATAARLTEASINGILSSLDSYSTYLPPEAFRDLKVQADGKYGGVGIDFVAEDGAVRVVAPIDGGPAHLAGVEAGDLITHVDGRPVHKLTTYQLTQRVRGAPGTKVTIAFHRNDGEPFDLTLTRAEVTTPSVRWRAEGPNGYVRISSFNGQTGDSLEEAIAALRGALGNDLNGMVLDLRRNPGGLLSEAVTISDAFLDDGGIVEVLGRWQEDNRRYEAKPGDLTAGARLVVLIDGGSASASELVAGALQDNRRAIVMGSRSFGKGTVQSVVPLRSGDTGIRLTTARYHTPSGRSVSDAAIVPNVAIVSQDDGVGGYTSLGSPDVIDAARCPAAGPEKQDRVLGCALALLEAGELGEFLARMRP